MTWKLVEEKEIGDNRKSVIFKIDDNTLDDDIESKDKPNGEVSATENEMK